MEENSCKDVTTRYDIHDDDVDDDGYDDDYHNVDSCDNVYNNDGYVVVDDRGIDDDDDDDDLGGHDYKLNSKDVLCHDQHVISIIIIIFITILKKKFTYRISSKSFRIKYEARYVVSNWSSLFYHNSL